MRAVAFAALLSSCAVTPSAVTPAPSPTAPPAPAAKPPVFRLGDSARPVRYAATLTVDPDTERFSGEISIDVTLATRTQAIWLHGRGLDVDRAEVAAGGATVKGAAQQGGEEYLGIILPTAVGPGAARLTVAYRGAIASTVRDGLFRERQGGSWFAFTSFEPVDARAVFPCFDEPGFKVPWQLTLKVPRGLVAASNTPVESEADEGALHVFRFAPTRPLPSYLVAFGVGPFERVDLGRWGKGQTPIAALIPKGRANETAMMRKIAGPALESLEAYFGVPYPYGKLDLVSAWSGRGAMENAGFITYASEVLLEKPEAITPESFRLATLLLVHEEAHQWFGDLVTMAWWDDLWLNETFADWLADEVMQQWHPDWEAREYDRTPTREVALNADSITSAPAVRPPVASNQQAAAFGSYAITYLKGREVLSMVEGWLGREKFRAGIRRYVSSHIDGNATTADLFAALAQETGRDVAPVLSTFIDQSGIPLVSVELRCAAGQAPALHLSQRRYLHLGMTRPDERRWKIPLCVRYPAGATAARACAVLEGPEQDMPLPEAKRCPSWVIPNEGERGYYRVSLDPKLWNALLGGAAPVTRAERAGLLGDFFALVGSGDLPVEEALAQVPMAVKSGDRRMVSLAAQFVGRLDATVVTDALRPKLVRMVREVFGPPARALGLKPRPKEDENTRLLRPVLLNVAGVTGEDPDLRQEARRLAAAWLADRKAVEPEVLDSVLRIAAEGGDAQLWEQMAAAALKTGEPAERRELFSAMGSFRAPELVKRTLELLMDPGLDLRDVVRPLLPRVGERLESRELAYAFVKSRWDELEPRSKASRMEDKWLLIVEGFCDAAHRKDVEVFFAPRARQFPGGDTHLVSSLEAIDHCIAVRERQQASAAAFLQKY